MASKNKSGKKQPAKKPTQKTERTPMSPEIKAIIMFFVSLLIFLIAIIPGDSFWKVMHTFFLGIFGWTVFFWTVYFCYIAFKISFGKEENKKSGRLVGVAITALLLGALVEMFGYSKGVSFGDFMRNSYGDGLLGCGTLGGILAYPLCLLLSKVGAIITLIVILTALILVVNGIPLYKFVKTVSKPAVKVTDTAKNAIDEHKQRMIESRRSGNIDIPLDDEEEKARKKKKKADSDASIDDKRNRLIDSYYGRETEQDDEKDITEEISPEEKQQAEIEQIVGRLNFETGEVEIISDENGEDASDETDDMAEDDEDFSTPDVVEVVSDEPEEYRYPPITLLNKNVAQSEEDINEELKANAAHLVNTLKSFGVETRLVDISRGPTVTRYELQPAAGVRINKITALTDDIALNLATAGVRIEAPIPNKSAVGIEVPNKSSASVLIRDVIDSETFANAEGKLTVAIGKDIAGNITTADLSKMPHILIAGTTGSGKSVCINTFLTSILYKASPSEVKMILIDPKVVELEVYNGLPHLLVPVVTQPRRAAGALGWAVTEMERRYNLFAECGVRDLQAYNEFARVNENFTPMPQILIVVDELNDLMMVAKAEVEDSIVRLAQKARAAGMHLVIATQRPSVDVITGLIKANVPSRIAFKVSNRFDSSTILDTQGAESLLGKGDMLFYPVGLSKPIRIQGCWVSDDEIKKVIKYITGDKKKEDVVYSSEIEAEIERHSIETGKGSKSKSDDDEGFTDTDELLDDAVEAILDAGVASTSHLQRKLRVGHSRAGRIMDILENKGIVGPYQGSKPRDILITRQQWMEFKINSVDFDD